MIFPPPPTGDDTGPDFDRDPYFSPAPRPADDLARALAWLWSNAGRVAVVLGGCAIVATHWYWLMLEVRAVRRELEFHSEVLSCLASGKTDCARLYLARRSDGTPLPRER